MLKLDFTMITIANFYFLFFILCALPVIGYPAILMANIMALSGYQPKKTPRLTMVMMKSFLWSTSLYPITYLFAVYKYRNTVPETHHLWAGLIALHILLIFIVFKGWTMTEGKSRKSKIKDTNK